MDSPDSQCQCSKAELDLFTTPPVNISMERADYVTHRPLASLADGGPIEFHVPGSAQDYIDIGRSKLKLKVKISKADGSNLGDGAKISTTNLLLHTLFPQVDCKLNEKLVTPSINTYAYKAYLETLLSHPRESKETWLQSEFYHQDHPPIDSNDPTAEGANPGLVTRSEKISKSKIVELVGRPHIDILQTDRYLLNGVDMSMKFTRSASNFHLIGPDVQGLKQQS